MTPTGFSVAAADERPGVLLSGADASEPTALRVSRSFILAPGKFAEANLDLEAGVGVAATFRADADVVWDVHSHSNGGVAVHREGVGSVGRVAYTADVAGAYSWLWANSGGAEINLMVSLELPAGARIVSWVQDQK